MEWGMDLGGGGPGELVKMQYMKFSKNSLKSFQNLKKQTTVVNENIDAFTH